MTGKLFENEKGAGPADVPPTDPAWVDEHRKRTYQSYEGFLRRKLAELYAARGEKWRRDYSSEDAYRRSVAPARRRLAEMLGWWVEPERRAAVKTFEEETLLEEKDFNARRFRMEVLPGLDTYGVELVPRTKGRHPGLIAQHGYSGTPELVCGLAASANTEDGSYRSLGLRAVRRGFHVVAVHHPGGYGSSEDALSGIPGFPNHPTTYGKNRLHRFATLAGGTLFGLDLMGSSRGVDVLVSRGDVDAGKIAIYGLSQGGQTAMYLAALDERIRASVSSGNFNERLTKLIGPIRGLNYVDSTEEDKFFREVVSHFSDADLVSLIAPRAFAAEAGLADTVVDFEKAEAEFARAREHYEKLGIGERAEFIAHREGHVSATGRAFEFLMENLERPT
ncbi:MAG: hypothetical protein V2A58_05460 [Planctomycetota bacterium]